MRFIHVHGCAVPVGHWFEGLIFIVKGGLGVYVHDIGHRVDGGPHGIGGDMPILKVSHPFQENKVALFIGDLGVGCTTIIVSLEAIGACVHIVRYLKLLFDMVFKLLDAGPLFVSFCKVFNIPLSEGGHKATYDGSEHICYALWGVQPIGKSSCTEDEMLTNQRLACDLCVMNINTRTKSFWKASSDAVQLQIEFER